MTTDQIIHGNQVLREYMIGNAHYAMNYHQSYDSMRPVWDKWYAEYHKIQDVSEHKSILMHKWAYSESPLELFTALVAAVEWLNGVKKQTT